MLDEKIKIIILKCFSKSETKEEMEVLTRWLKDSENELIFNDFVKTNFLIDFEMVDFSTEDEKEKIFKRIKINKSIFYKKRLKSIYKYAAIFVGIIGLGYVYFIDDFNNSTNEQKIRINSEVEIQSGSDKAILTTESGTQVILEKGKKITLKGSSSDGEKLVYDTSAPSEKSEIKYNYLTIPRGGQFFVQLADGTKVWLNSDSKLKYPVKFKNNEIRQVELVYGEAYFEVSPSTKHNGTLFNVITKNQEVSVLGTEFNIKAYNDDMTIKTTLVEGKVVVKNEHFQNVLKPNQQAVVAYNSKAIQVYNVDVSQEVSWVNGLFVLNEMPLKEMMKILSRWYNVDVIYESEEKKDFIFTGVLERTKSINKILKLIEITNKGEINFEIKNNIITIK